MIKEEVYIPNKEISREFYNAAEGAIAQIKDILDKKSRVNSVFR